MVWEERKQHGSEFIFQKKMIGKATFKDCYWLKMRRTVGSNKWIQHVKKAEKRSSC